jgi:hypothetical protein
MDKKLVLSELSVNDINIIFAGLGKLPMEAVVELWMRLKQQAEAQVAEAAPQQVAEAAPPQAAEAS